MTLAALDAPRGFVPVAEYTRVCARLDDLEYELKGLRIDTRGVAMLAVERALDARGQVPMLLGALAKAGRVPLSLSRFALLAGFEDIYQMRVLIHALRQALKRLDAPANCIETSWGPVMC